MGKLLTALLGLFGAAASQPAREPEVRNVDPSTIYFSMSTIANDMAPLEAPGEIVRSDLALHEDEWRQIEFFPADRLAEIQTMMRDLASFEAANRHGDVFRNIFVRTLPEAPVMAGEDATQRIAAELGVDLSPAPILFQGGNSATGRIANGFALRLGSNVSLFGYRGGGGVMVLSAHVGAGGDHEVLTRAFMRLSRAHRLIAVDWRSHLILVGVSANGQIEAWRPD
jgi:hypothetical protein